MFTEYSVLLVLHKDLGNDSFSSKFSYNHFRMAWYGYTQLLDIDLKKGFLCNICEKHPQRVIMDATTLSFRKDFDPWCNFLTDSKKKEIASKGKR